MQEVSDDSTIAMEMLGQLMKGVQVDRQKLHLQLAAAEQAGTKALVFCPSLTLPAPVFMAFSNRATSKLATRGEMSANPKKGRTRSLLVNKFRYWGNELS